MSNFPRQLAVDFGATALRGLGLGPDAKGRPMVWGAAQFELPPEPGKGAEAFPLLLQGCKELTTRLPPGKSQVSLCLGGPAVFSRVIKIPVSDPAKVESMVRFEAQQTVPAIEQAVWDYQILPGNSPGESEIFLLAIKKESVDEAVAAASSASLPVSRVDLVPSALLNVFRFSYPEETRTALLLDIGARATTILLVDASRVFCRVVPLGGLSISQAIATDLQESLAGAETLKLAKGFVHPGGAYEDSQDAVAARISKLARGVMTRLHTEVERSITFFRSQQGGDRPQQIYLSGGGAMMGFIDLFFQEKLRAPVSLLQPFRRLAFGSGVPQDVLKRNFPAWSVAVGTALGGLPACPCRINALSTAGRQRNDQIRDRPAQKAVVIAAALLLCFPGLHGLWQAGRIQKHLDARAGEVQEAEEALAQLEAKAKELQKLMDTLEQGARFERARLAWLALLDELAAKAPAGLWVTELKAAEGSSEPSAGNDPQKSMLEIRGMFETRSAEADARAVEEFAKSLSQGGLLQNVKISEREAPDYQEGKTEQVALKFVLLAEWPQRPDWQNEPVSAGKKKNQ